MNSILVVSHSYPLKLAPYKAKFIQDQVVLFKDSEKFNIDVLNLTPLTLPFTARRKEVSQGFCTYGEKVDQKKYLSLPKKKLPRLIQRNLSRSLFDHLRENHHDIIHLHWLYPAGLSIKYLKEKGYKVVLTIHGSDWYQSVNIPSVKKLVIEGLHYVDKILFSGPKLMNDVITNFPELKHKSMMIYNFIDSKVFRLPSPKEKAAKKGVLGFDSKKVNILTVANLREEKGIDLLVKAASNVANQSTHFHIVGSIDQSEYANAVFDSIQSLNLGSLITFHGTKPPAEIIDYYYAADFFLLPSRREGFNVSLLEATATGLPVVCTNVGGNSLVVDESVGKIVPSGNFSELANQLVFMISNYSKFSNKIISEQTISSYSEYSMIDRLSNVYNEILNEII